MPVVFDTNVIVSAFQFGGNPARLVEMVRAGRLDAVISPSILAEVTRILGGKFGWPGPDLENVVGILKRYMAIVEPMAIPRAVKDDPDDDHIVACAVASGADAIITGDKHLLSMGAYEGIAMVRVGEFLGRQR